MEYEKLSFESFANAEVPEALQYLIDAENVILSPHVAGWTFESHAKLAQTIVDKILLLYNPELAPVEKSERVTGLGGFFFKANDPKTLKDWYRDHLGMNTDDYGCTFWWKDKNGADCSTQWSLFQSDTDYFEPSQNEFMQNFRVKNLTSLVDQLKSEGVVIVGEMQLYDYGKFAHILDLEGNKIELWEPIDSVFL